MASSTEPVALAFFAVQPEGCDNEKPPIIFVHGVSACKEFWRDIPYNVANATKRKVYAVDLRNHGDSAWSETDDFECNIGDLLHFMDSIGAPRAVLVGHSLGGATAMRVAWMANERVEKIVVEDMPVQTVSPFIHEMVLGHMALNQAAVQRMPQGLKEDEAKEFIVDFVYNGIPEDVKKVISKPIKEHYDGKLKPTEDGRYTFKANVQVLEKSVQNAKEKPSEPSGVYNGPTCFIYGKKSPFNVGSDEENVKKYFPNAEFVGIENATHLVHTDCPQEFTEALLQFLSRE